MMYTLLFSFRLTGQFGPIVGMWHINNNNNNDIDNNINSNTHVHLYEAAISI